MRVLIVVDVQNGFITKDCYKLLREKIEKLLLENKYDKYIFTKFINKDNSLYETKLNWFKLKDKEETDFAVTLPKNSIIFEKFGYGLSNEQIEEIKNLGANEVDVCGLQTDACVYAISFQLFDAGIYPNILFEFCETSPNRKEISKEILIHQFGKVDERK